MNEPVRCAICQQPGGERYCRDLIACNYRARRRLGMSASACRKWAKRDVARQRNEQAAKGAAATVAHRGDAA